MASAWQTMEEAALTLGISSRTLHRRLAKGEFETRMENGRREVLVVVDEQQVYADPSAQPQPVAVASDAAVADGVTDATSDMADTNEVSADCAEFADPAAPTELSDEIQTTMLALHEDRIRRTDLAIM